MTQQTLIYAPDVETMIIQAIQKLKQSGQKPEYHRIRTEVLNEVNQKGLRYASNQSGKPPIQAILDIMVNTGLLQQEGNTYHISQ